MIAAASCAKEYVETSPIEEADMMTFRVSFTGNATKTDLSESHTVWADGDSILFSDGAKTVKAAIPDEYAGMSYAEIAIPEGSISTTDTVYAVYPPAAFKSAKGGVVSLAVSKEQSGNFNDANICVAMSMDDHFELSNATAVMKFTVPDGIETVVLTAAPTDTLAGTLAVSCSAENPITVNASSPLKSIKVVTGGLGGEYYVSVVPGTYQEFSIVALALDGKSQKRETTNKALAINDLADLGTIGTKMIGSRMTGSGTEIDPFRIKDIADLITFATMVNSGLTYEGQFFALEANIEGMTIPIGTYDQVAIPFMGTFDGKKHTVTLDMGGEGVSDSYLALFGALGSGAVIKNVTVSGSVNTTGNYVAGIAAYANQTSSDSPVTIVNCKNSASIKGKGYVGGILGYAKVSASSNTTLIDNCTNEGTVTATGNNVAGVAGYVAGYSDAVRTSIANATNSGAVTGNNNVAGIVGRSSCVTISGVHNLASASIKSTSTNVTGVYNAASKTTIDAAGKSASNYDYATGGVAGFAQNSSIQNSDNAASVTGFIKVGGIVGGTYWCPVTSCRNTGAVEGTGSFTYNVASQMGLGAGSLVGGIVGWLYTQGHINSCENAGTIKGQGGIGGIVGYVSSTSNSSSLPVIRNCKNSGDVITTGAVKGGNSGNNAATGGICGISTSYTNKYPSFIECENTGNVSSNIQAVGGIVGRCTDGQDTGSAVIDKCVNSGNITGTFWVSGILGVCSGRNRNTLTLTNCSNTGTITGTRADDNGVCAAGMLGGYGNNGGTNKTVTTYVYNCINEGDILYTSEAFVKPYCGGIAGNTQAGSIQNVYNSGFVGVASRGAVAENADKYLGQIAGLLSFTAKEAYYLDPSLTANTATLAVGSSSTGTHAECVVACDASGEFAESLTFKEEDYSDLVSILNGWVAKSSNPAKYYTWSAGPVFVK